MSETWAKGPCRYPGWYNSAPDPLMITGMLKWELRQLFQPNKTRLPMLEDVLWVPNPDNQEEMDIEHTGIVIEAAELPRREITGKCPQIIIKRGDITMNRPGIMGSREVGITPVTAGTLHSMLFQGQWSVIASSVVLGVAERIGWEVLLYFLELENVIQRFYRLSRFRVANLSEVAVGESEGPDYLVVMQLEIAFNSGWEVAAQAPRLKNIHMTLEE